MTGLTPWGRLSREQRQARMVMKQIYNDFDIAVSDQDHLNLLFGATLAADLMELEMLHAAGWDPASPIY